MEMLCEPSVVDVTITQGSPLTPREGAGATPASPSSALRGDFGDAESQDDQPRWKPSSSGGSQLL